MPMRRSRRDPYPQRGRVGRAALVVDIRRMVSDVVVTTFISRPPVELEPHSAATQRLWQLGRREVPTAPARERLLGLRACSGHTPLRAVAATVPVCSAAVRTDGRVLCRFAYIAPGSNFL